MSADIRRGPFCADAPRSQSSAQILNHKEEITMTHPEQVRSFLWADISEMSKTPEQFSKNPDADFTRERKLNLDNLLRLIVTMGSDTISSELLQYFNYDINTLSSPAFYQQRKKLLVGAFPYLLRLFNSHFPFEPYMGEYNLIAVDGSEFNIPRNPDDPDTFHPPNGKSKKGFNMLHAVASYALLSKSYLDCVIQPGRKKNEFQAGCDIIDGYSYGGTPLFVVDRGFSSYNFYAHAIEKGAFFLVRAKDVNVRRLLRLDTLPEQLDTDIEIILSRTQSKKKMKRPELSEQYRYVSRDVSFDYIEPGSDDEYPMPLRIVRFKVADGVYENIVTNLPADRFPSGEIKRLYRLRWGIETSFRDLKHTVGAINFHSKKVEYIEQEIWSRLILFNFCAFITTHVIVAQNSAKHVYQVNFAMALKICLHFIRLRADEPPPDVEGLIGSFTLPVRPGRNYARQHRFHPPASFSYRFS
jgi:hypothetical protein